MSVVAAHAVRVSVLVPVSDRWDPSSSWLADVERFVADGRGAAEAVFVFDGHRGREAAGLREHVAGRDGMRVIELHQRMGEAAVLAAAIREARGDMLVRVPPYPQTDLSMLSEVASAMESGADCVLVERVTEGGARSGGWQRRALNRVLTRVSRVDVRDAGCQVCGLTREAAVALPLQGDLHRYLPILVAMEGFSTVHVSARTVEGDRRRRRRTLRSYLARMLDFFTVMFLARSTGSPLRVFGLLGLGPLALGFLLTLWLVWERLFLSRPLAGRPLLLLGLLLITAGLQALAIGFLGELMVYLHYRDRHPDRVRALKP
jgi:hypothetical protein